jgi:hypothetical protein
MAEKRTRLEIIMSQALEDDFLRELETAIPGGKYTKLSGVHGKGFSVPKLGDAVWPQENTLFILYAAESEEKSITAIVQKLRKEYLGEGVACFKSGAEEI